MQNASFSDQQLLSVDHDVTRNLRFTSTSSIQIARLNFDNLGFEIEDCRWKSYQKLVAIYPHQKLN